MAAFVLAPAIDTRMIDRSAIAANPVYGDRPLLRGRFHQFGAVASFPAGALLVLRYASPEARFSAMAYALTGFLMFFTSASYHRLADSVMARFWMRRLDHSMIFIHIAGATTPIALLGLGGTPGLILLATSWGGALVGVLLKLTQLTIERDPCPWLFPVLGWLPLLALPSLVASAGVAAAALLVGSALVYAAGGVCFSRKNPNPVPTIFGYHEIFHICTLVAGVGQFALTARLVAA